MEHRTAVRRVRDETNPWQYGMYVMRLAEDGLVSIDGREGSIKLPKVTI
jgi:hypothetical protein